MADLPPLTQRQRGELLRRIVKRDGPGVTLEAVNEEFRGLGQDPSSRMALYRVKQAVFGSGDVGAAVENNGAVVKVRTTPAPATPPADPPPPTLLDRLVELVRFQQDVEEKWGGKDRVRELLDALDKVSGLL